MIVTPVKTRILIPPKDDLLDAISVSLKSLPEKSIVVFTSKIVSIWQGRCVPLAKYPNKDALIIEEADAYLPRNLTPGKWCIHTFKNNLFIPSAGVDSGNTGDYYILWPRNPKHAAKKLYDWLRKKYHIKHLGVVICDSHSNPLRRGVLGISLAHYGFIPLKEYRGKIDLFKKPFMAQTNIADGLATTATMVMGEGTERTPLVVIKDVPWIQFAARPFRSKRKFSSFEIKMKEDKYFPLFSKLKWKKGGSGKNIK